MNRGTALMEQCSEAAHDVGHTATKTANHVAKHDLSITEQRVYKPQYTGDADSRINGQFVLSPNNPDTGLIAGLVGQIYGNFQTGDEVRRCAKTLDRAADDLDRQNGITPGADEDAIHGQPNFDATLIGCVAVNSTGKVGLVSGFMKLPWGWSFIGFNVDNGEQWAGRSPVAIATNLGDFISRRVNQARAAGRENR